MGVGGEIGGEGHGGEWMVDGGWWMGKGEEEKNR
jgi:hypothetical protein